MSWKFYNSNGALLQSVGGGAGEVDYAPAVGADWGTDPDDAAEALDQVAARLTDAEAVLAVGNGVNFGPAAVASITVVDGIITAIS